MCIVKPTAASVSIFALFVTLVFLPAPAAAVPGASCPAECFFDFSRDRFRCVEYYVLAIACQVQLRNFCVEEFCVIYDADETTEAACVDDRPEPTLEVKRIEEIPARS